MQAVVTVQPSLNNQGNRQDIGSLTLSRLAWGGLAFVARLLCCGRGKRIPYMASSMASSMTRTVVSGMFST